MNDLLQFNIEFMASRYWFLIPMFAGGMGFWLLLRLMGWSVGVTWNEIWEELKKDNVAVARYFGLRAVAVALVVGLVTVAGAIASKL